METLIVIPKTKKQLTAIKAILNALDVTFREEGKSTYNPEFVEKIKKSEKNFQEGKFKSIKNEDLWK